MNDHASTEPRVLTCRSAADFLAALPSLVGFTAANSLFLVHFTGKRAGQAMRVDLPARDNPDDTQPLLDLLCHAVRATRSGHPAAAVVITTAGTFAESGGPPWGRFAARIQYRLRREGIELRELCIVASDGWVSVLDADAPPGGRPLSDIAASSVTQQLRANDESIPDLAELGSIPAADHARVAVVREALQRRPSGASDGQQDPAFTWIAEIAMIARALCDPSLSLSIEQTALLAHCAASSDRWLLLAGLSRELIDREQLRQVRSRLLTAISEVPMALRPGLLALSAWIWWLSGLQSVAQRHLSAAFDIDPEDRLAHQVGQLIAYPSTLQEASRAA